MIEGPQPQKFEDHPKYKEFCYCVDSGKFDSFIIKMQEEDEKRWKSLEKPVTPVVCSD